MRRPRLHRAPSAVLSLGVLGSGLLILGATHAAFTAYTDNAGNTATAGTASSPTTAADAPSSH